MLPIDTQVDFIREICENQPDSVVWVTPVRDRDATDGAGSIIDFCFQYCNRAAQQVSGNSNDQMIGKYILRDRLPDPEWAEIIFEQCLQVYHTGEPLEYAYYSNELGKYLSLHRSKVQGGVLTMVRNRTDGELDAIFNGSLSAVYSAQVVRDEVGRVFDLVFIRANKAFHQIFGTTESIIGKSLLSVAGDESQEEFIGYANNVMAAGVPLTQVLHYHNPERWFEFSMVKLEEDLLLVTVNDITKQREAVSKIEEQKNLLDSILRYSPNGLAITEAIRDEEGQMVDARAVIMNDACEKYNGIPNEIMLSNSYATLSPELLKSDLFKAATTLTTGEPFRTEYQLPQTGIWIELAIAKMDEERFINVFTDITAVKEAQVHLERLVEELRRSNSSLEDFAYAVSHDLKEPIRKIRVFSEQLKAKYQSVLDETGVKYFERLDVAAQRMKLLVDDLLEYAHVNQGMSEIEEVNLQVKAEKALEDLELAIMETGAVVHVGKLPVVSGNKRQLQQVFQNLISNAIKYHKPGIAPEVSVTAEVVSGKDLSSIKTNLSPEQRFHLIQVKDNGIGFEQKNAERIFNVFTRLHSSAEYTGTGVGLSIVRKVVENHGGFINVTSVPNEGATFAVYLPA